MNDLYIAPCSNEEMKQRYSKYVESGFNVDKLRNEIKEQLNSTEFDKSSRKTLDYVKDQLGDKSILEHLQGKESSTEAFEYGLELCLEDLDKFNNSDRVFIPQGDISKYRFSKGDKVLAYTGDATVTKCFSVRESVEIPALSNLILKHRLLEVSEKVLVADNSRDINISGSYISEVGDWNVDYVIGFVRLQPDKVEDIIIDEFGSIDAFLDEAESNGIY